MALKRSRAFGNWVFYLIITLLLGVLPGCAEVQVRPLPPPPPSPKIRVFVQAITGPGRWKNPEEEFNKGFPRLVQNVLRQTGIYEVASIEDSKSVLVGSGPLTRWDWAKKDWELARRVGRGLHADYAIIASRTKHKGYILWDMTFLNVANGKQYRSVSRAPKAPYLEVEDYAKMFRVNFRKIFREAKRDMLATAIQKSPAALLMTPVQPGPGPAPPPPAPPPQISSPAVQEEPLPVVSKEMGEVPEELEGVTVLDLEKILTAESQPDSRKRLAVYDLETIEPLRVVGLILSEALREELMRLGHFALVNRENLVQVLKEIGLQMTGLVDEKQAVKVGKGLAASQIVMGRYSALGKTGILQVKRIDVESQGTLAMGSLRCSQGKEDELLAQMAELARKLAGAN